MTPDRFRACLAALDWSQRGLADYLGIRSETTVRDWGRGKTSIPHHVASWLELRAQNAEAHPFPEGWQRDRPPSRQTPS